VCCAIWDWNPSRIKVLFSCPKLPDQLWVPLDFIFIEHQGSFLEVKHPGCDFGHSPPSSAEMKNEFSYMFTLLMCFYGVDRENITFTIL
jgi:hypothetical protein